MPTIPLSLLHLIFFVAVLVSINAAGAVRHHVITFGKWMNVPWFVDSGPQGGGDTATTIKVRPLLVDTQVKEFTLGPPHDITDRLFVVRRAFRVNDSLPQESPAPHWQWQRGGWLLIDRITGHVSAINLPEFDSAYSEASWFRDYVAYCGISDDTKKHYAVVVEVGRRKPLLRKLLEGTSTTAGRAEASACPAPAWQRNPSRVSFEADGIPKQVFTIRGRAADLATAEDEEEEASK